MTDERQAPTYARRRELREARTLPQAPPVPPPPTWAADPPGAAPPPPPAPPPSPRDGSRGPVGPARPAGRIGPTTQELELYRVAAEPPARPSPFDPDRAQAPHDDSRANRARGFVERWSLWASGLGLPARDPSGRRPYPSREGMLPPAVLIAAGLGVAGLVGLLTGVLLTGGGGGSAAAAATTEPTVTVTQSVTPPAETRTRTRTRTTTATVTATPTAAAAGPARDALGPGSQGTAVAQLQQDLLQLGIYRGLPSGDYDGQTRAAVQDFQQRSGITDDQPGVAGPSTLAAIDRALGR